MKSWNTLVNPNLLQPETDQEAPTYFLGDRYSTHAALLLHITGTKSPDITTLHTQ